MCVSIYCRRPYLCVYLPTYLPTYLPIIADHIYVCICISIYCRRPRQVVWTAENHTRAAAITVAAVDDDVYEYGLHWAC